MSHRKEVFKSKVLQRLYPAAPKLEKEPSPSHVVEALAKKSYVKRKAAQEDAAAGDAGQTQSAPNPRRHMYTVLPPPADYKTQSEKSVTLPRLESINNTVDSAEDSFNKSDEEPDQDKEQEGQKRKKRRRKKRKTTVHQDSRQDGTAPGSESSGGVSQTAVDEGGQHMSRNKKRKLKKKRHKERLLSMGVVPQAAALEFTYQKDGVEEEEYNERRAAEVSDFLRTTLEIYMSDSSLHVEKLPLLSSTVDDLLSHISSGCKPNSILKQLSSLIAFIKQKETGKLEKALKELYNNSCMSAEETDAVVLLFQYWITDILPARGEKKTEISTTHT